MEDKQLRGHLEVQTALDRERQRSSTIRERCTALEQDLEECAMDYEVQLYNMPRSHPGRS